MRRVVIGAFDEVAGQGLLDFVQREGFELVGGPVLNGNVVETLLRVEADVVLLDLDRGDSLVLAQRIAAETPLVTVIALSTESPVMRVFPSLRGGESYESELNMFALALTIKHA